MPGYKNSFRSPSFRDETILDKNGDVFGTVRLKPSTILWKPKNTQKYYAVKLEKFTEWIVAGETKAKRTTS